MPLQSVDRQVERFPVIRNKQQQQQQKKKGIENTKLFQKAQEPNKFWLPPQLDDANIKNTTP